MTQRVLRDVQVRNEQPGELIWFDLGLIPVKDRTMNIGRAITEAMVGAPSRKPWYTRLYHWLTDQMHRT